MARDSSRAIELFYDSVSDTPTHFFIGRQFPVSIHQTPGNLEQSSRWVVARRNEHA